MPPPVFGHTTHLLLFWSFSVCSRRWVCETPHEGANLTCSCTWKGKGSTAHGGPLTEGGQVTSLWSPLFEGHFPWLLRGSSAGLSLRCSPYLLLSFVFHPPLPPWNHPPSETVCMQNPYQVLEETRQKQGGILPEFSFPTMVSMFLNSCCCCGSPELLQEGRGNTLCGEKAG